MKRKLLFLFLFAFLAALAAAQDPSTIYGRCHDPELFKTSNLADTANNAKLKLALGVSRPCNLPLVQGYILSHPPQFSTAQLEQMAQSLLTYVQQARQDKQVGASDNSVGTTSLVTKGVGALVGVALESGSIQRTTSGNVATVTINSAQAANFLSAGAVKPCAVIESDCSFGRKLLSGLTVMTTYDVAQANTSTNSTAAQAALASLVGGNEPAFTGVSARVDLHARKKNVQLPDLAKAYQSSKYLSVTKTYASAFNELIASIESNPEYEKAIEGAIADLTNTALNDTEPKVNEILQNLEIAIAKIIDENAPSTAAFKSYASAENAYHGARDTALQAVLNKWTLSFQYDYNRLASQPDQSDFKAIYSYRRDAGNDKVLQVTANASATISDSLLGSTTYAVSQCTGGLPARLHSYLCGVENTGGRKWRVLFPVHGRQKPLDAPVH